MVKATSIECRQVFPGETALMRELLGLFGEVFEMKEEYCERQPSDEYLCRLLDSETFIAMVALDEGAVVGGLTAYELRKYEQPRSEIYIYDLAVAASRQRQGIATALIGRLKVAARRRGAYVIFVQADQGDCPPISLYSKLGKREDVHHFDIDVGEEQKKS